MVYPGINGLHVSLLLTDTAVPFADRQGRLPPLVRGEPVAASLALPTAPDGAPALGGPAVDNTGVVICAVRASHPRRGYPPSSDAGRAVRGDQPDAGTVRT